MCKKYLAPSLLVLKNQFFKFKIKYELKKADFLARLLAVVVVGQHILNQIFRNIFIFVSFPIQPKPSSIYMRNNDHALLFAIFPKYIF